MSPRKRLPENRPLPARWKINHGAYYYIVPPGQEAAWDGKKWFRLGSTLSEAHRTYADRVQVRQNVTTIGQLLDLYLIEVVPDKAPKTATENRKQIATLRAVFADIALADLEPQHVYQYASRRKSKAPSRGDGKTAAKREIEVLSHAFTKAVEWGLIKAHPFKGEVRIAGAKPRTRYVEDWELAEALALKPLRKKGGAAVVQALIRLKILTGLRQRDLLQIVASDMMDDGLHVTLSKTRNSTGKRVIYEWTSELRIEIDHAVKVRPALSPYLFCTRDGACFVRENGTAPAFNTLWQNFMEKLLSESRVTERFTEHDIRAKTASDAESLERARQLLGHADARMTEKFYRRKPEKIKPAK